MADDNPKSTDVDDSKPDGEDKSQITKPDSDESAKQLAKLKSDLADAQKLIADLTPLADDAKKAIQQRQDAKKKAGEFEELYNGLEPKYKSLETSHKELEAKYNALIQEQRSELLAQVPEALRSDLEDADLKTIRIAIKASGVKVVTAPDKGGQGAPNPNQKGDKKISQMTKEEQQTLLRELGQTKYAARISLELREEAEAKAREKSTAK